MRRAINKVVSVVAVGSIMTTTARFIQAITILLAQTTAAVAVLAMSFSPQPANAIQTLRTASVAGDVQPVAYLPVVLSHAQPDAYEPDDTCATQSNIVPGEAQTRTFESLTGTLDLDLIQVTFLQAGRYDARTAAIGSGTQPSVSISVACGGAVLDAFTPGSPIRLVVPSDHYTVYLAAQNMGAANAQDTTYRISISTAVVVHASTTDDGVRVVALPPTLPPISKLSSSPPGQP